MKKHELIKIVASLVVFLCLATLTGCGHESVSLADNAVPEKDETKESLKYRSPEAAAILNALKEDNQIVSKLNLTEDVKTQAMVEYIVGGMKRVDISECPLKFRKAYSDHIAAWQRVLRTVHEYSHVIPTMREWIKVSALHGTESRTELEREVFAALDDIDSTYDECVSIAADYEIKRSEYRTKD
ncbi:hypothetical protein [Gimesia maris]|uniref:Lipoprotein n=1 Tax=Gimesia maris TaxID=122 RepID=A0ABX5YR67_9PLAN|nr:hypothetical protein [Gimesia maris]EDL59242.1 hypothetical protein PM8797T_23384 [Gimesia maris DSM 8797]QEG18220.1 hypothetical protein GmarT_41060 [Gimesia maris]QGQ28779.1 hypothetical protein F1729_09060 [Gimesia maris]